MPYRESVRSFIWADLRWLFFWVCLFAFIGLLFNYFLVGVVIGLLVFIFRQWRALYILHHWVKFKSNEHPPNVNGILSDLSLNFYHTHKSEVKTRETLLNNVQRVRQSISALDACVVLIDRNSSVEWWNPAASNLLGLKPSDTGANILNLIREPSFISFFNGNNFDDSFTMTSWIDDKKTLEFEITAFGDNDKLMIVEDVSRIFSLEKMRTDFIANISHELRTPLTVFSGYIETFMEQDGLNPTWQRAFTLMQQQTTRMNNIVNDLLMLSRLENEQNLTSHQFIDMPNLMMQLFDQAQAYNSEYGHVIDLQIESQQGLYGDRKELISALTNLIFNAIKYTPKGGEIIIGWHIVDNTGYFSVTDNGIGIASQHLDRLTERFYRVDSGRSRETGGTGLGLAIVKHVLYRHNAVLEVTSEINKGSVFTAVFRDINTAKE